MRAAVAFLARFCREHPLEDKLLLVPSFVAGRQIGNALAEEAGSWTNLRFVTASLLAMEVLAKAGPGGAARPMTSSAELALTDRVVRALLTEGELRYFGRAGAPPGLAVALHRAIRDLRLDGRTSRDIRPDHFLVAEKGRELALILARYERALVDEGSLDLAGLLGEALRAAANAPPISSWLLAPLDHRLSRLEAELVRAAGGGSFVLVPGDPVVGLERPRRAWLDPGPADPDGAGPLTWLFAPRLAPPGQDARIEIFRALGQANECREILRRLYTEKVPFDHVEILTPPGSAHATVFHLFAARTGLPVTFGEGIPVSFTSPGRLFFGLISWMVEDFSSDELGRLLENGDLKPAAGPGDEALPARTACRLLRQAMIGWGRERYLPRLAALREGLEADLAALAAGGGEEEGGEVEGPRSGFMEAIAGVGALSSAISRLLDFLPRPDLEGNYDLRRLCEAFVGIIAEFAAAGSEHDGQARRVLLDRLSEFTAESRLPALSLKEALDLLRTAGASLRVGASAPQPGRLHVASLRSGGLSGRAHTYVAGLDEASMPGRGLQDPVLLDEERAAISPSLTTSAETLRAGLYDLAAVLAGLRGRVVLSYPAFDIVEGRESFPSSVVLQAFRLLRRDSELDYAALDRALPEAAGFLPGGAARAFDETEWWLDRLTAGPPCDGPRSVAANFPGLAAGLNALAARAGDRLTTYDGLVDITPLRAEIDPLSGGRAVMSATRLELLAKCPFGYFLRHVLKIQPPEEVAFDRSRWLDPLQRGSLIHEILCEFMTGVAGREEEVRASRHAAVLTEVAEAHIGRMKLKVPPPSDGIFESERRDIREALSIFLAAEEKREAKGRPLAFEKEIPGESIALDARRSFRLRGFIDRIDRIGRDTYRIIDYKTGNPAPYENLVHFGRGRTLQPALYAVALEQMLARESPGSAPRVAESGYFFTSRRGEGDEVMVRDFDRGRLRALLGDLFALLENGYFIPGPAAKCEYCDYLAACLSGGPERAAAKRAANPEIFAAYDKLDEYQ
jgi:RecB family exonuclease